MSTALNDLLHNAEKAQKLREILKNQARNLSLDDVREIQDKLQLAHTEGRKALEAPEEIPEAEQPQAREALEQIDRAHADAHKVFERKYRWQTEVEGNAQIITDHAGRAANLHKILREKRRELSARDVEGMHDELNRLESEALAAWGVARGFNLPVSLEHRLFRATEAITNALKDAFGTLARKKQWEDAVAMNVSAIEAEMRKLEALVMHGAPAREAGAGKRKGGRAADAPDGESAAAGEQGSARSDAGAAHHEADAAHSEIHAASGEGRAEAHPDAGADSAADTQAASEAAGTRTEDPAEGREAASADQHMDDALDAAFDGLSDEDSDEDADETVLAYRAAGEEADGDERSRTSTAEPTDAASSSLPATDADSRGPGADAREADAQAEGAGARATEADAQAEGAGARAPEADAHAEGEDGAASSEAHADTQAAGSSQGQDDAGQMPRQAGPEIGRLAKKIEEMLRTRRPLDRSEQDRLAARLNGMLERARAAARAEAPPRESKAPAARKFSREEMHRAKSEVENALAQSEAALGLEWPPPRRPGSEGAAAQDASHAHPSEAGEAAHDEVGGSSPEAGAEAGDHAAPVEAATEAATGTPVGGSAGEAVAAGGSTEAPSPTTGRAAPGKERARRLEPDAPAPAGEPMKLGAIKVVQGLLMRAREVLESGAVPGGDRKGLWARFRNASDNLRNRRTETRTAELSHLQARADEAGHMAREGNPANARRSIQEIQRMVVECGLGKGDRDALLKSLRESWEASLGRQDTLRQDRKRREEEGLNKLGEHFQRWEGRVENISALISRLEEQLLELKERQRTSTSIGYRVVAEQRINETKGRIQELKGVLTDLSGKIEDVKPRLEAAGWGAAQAEAMAEAIRANDGAISADQTGGDRTRVGSNRREERGSRDIRGPAADTRSQGGERGPRPGGENRGPGGGERGPRPGGENRGPGGGERGPRPGGPGPEAQGRGPSGDRHRSEKQPSAPEAQSHAPAADNPTANAPAAPSSDSSNASE